MKRLGFVAVVIVGVLGCGGGAPAAKQVANPEASEASKAAPPPVSVDPKIKVAAGEAMNTPTARKVVITATAAGFSPASIEANPNEPITLVFDRADEKGCPGVTFDEIGMGVDIELGKKSEVMITAPAKGNFGFTCNEGGAKGAITVRAP